MIPIVTLVGTDFGYMLTGSMLIEKVFSIPGIGKLAVDAMSNRDLRFWRAPLCTSHLYSLS